MNSVIIRAPHFTGVPVHNRRPSRQVAHTWWISKVDRWGRATTARTARGRQMSYSRCPFSVSLKTSGHICSETQTPSHRFPSSRCRREGRSLEFRRSITSEINRPVRPTIERRRWLWSGTVRNDSRTITIPQDLQSIAQFQRHHNWAACHPSYWARFSDTSRRQVSCEYSNGVLLQG